MITVAFIETNSTTEKAISIILVLILSGTFAYSLGSITTLLQEFLKDENELKLNLIILI